MQEHLTLTNDFYTKKPETISPFDSISNLDHLQNTICQLLSDVQDQENQIRSSLNDIRQTINNFEFSKPSYIEETYEILGPSLRSNFNTASLPYRWWNRSMPCLPLLNRHKYSSGSQDSLSESFQVRYFTPKKHKKPIAKTSNNQNSGYCIWLPHKKTGEVYCFRV